MDWLNNDNSKWNWFPHFVIRSTGFPYEWMNDLRLTKTFDLFEHGVGTKIEHLERIFDEELGDKRRQLKMFFDTEEFRQAVFISNPDMYQHIDRYIQYFDPNRRTSKVKRIEKKLFSYLQRFCGKNESASFFGPLNYGQVDEQINDYWKGEFLYSGITQRRESFLSFWAVRELEKIVAEEKELQPYIPLHIPAWVKIEEEYLVISTQKRIKIHNWIRSILLYIQNTSSNLNGIFKKFPAIEREKIDQVLEQLITKGIVKRQWFLPSSIENPLNYLIEQLLLLPDSYVKEKWCKRLKEFADEVKQLAELQINDRQKCLEKLEQSFKELSGKPSRRGKASLYADRFIYYEDAHGHVKDFKFGRPFIKELQTKLSGALNISAAYGEEVWKFYQDLGKRIFDEMQNSIIPFPQFIAKLRDRYPDVPEIPQASFSNNIQQLIREKGSEKKVIELQSKQLGIMPSNRSFYSLPDLFLQAKNKDALRNGEVTIILAKLHHHLLMHNWMTYFYEDKVALENDLLQLIGQMNYVDGTSLYGIEVMRRNKAFYQYPSKVVEYAEKPIPEKESIKLSDLVVVKDEQSGNLLLKDRSTFEEIELYIPLADQVSYLPFAMFSKPMLLHVPISCGEHTPRVVIDGVVYQRERWHYLSNKLLKQFKHLFGLYLLINVEEWRIKEKVPEVVYIKGSNVRKPYWIDFRNYFAVELFMSVLSENDEIIIEEMLPDPNHLWLTSSKGSHSCELRMSVYKLGIKEVIENV